MGLEYIGNIATTKSGKTCQRWDSQTPHAPTNFGLAKSSLIESAGNKCRNPDEGTSPWCYTTDPATRWEHCNIPMCDGKQLVLLDNSLFSMGII